MKISIKSRSALTAAACLAKHGDVPLNVADISDKTGISISYLEQLFCPLRRAGLVVGVRGPGGGYRLARHPSRITVYDVMASFDEGERNSLLPKKLEERVSDCFKSMTLLEVA